MPSKNTPTKYGVAQKSRLLKHPGKSTLFTIASCQTKRGGLDNCPLVLFAFSIL